MFVHYLSQECLLENVRSSSWRNNKSANFWTRYTYKRTSLEDIKFDENGDFDMYGKESDPYTYDAIKIDITI